MSNTQWVRAHIPSLGEYRTMTAAQAERRGLKVVDRPALDRNGRPLPAQRVTRATVQQPVVVTEPAPLKPSGKASETTNTKESA